MKLKIAVLVISLMLSACAPELLPVPVTQVLTSAPVTPTLVTINAPVVSPPDLVFIHMLDEKNGWGISDTNVLRTVDGGTTWYNVGPEKISALGYSVIADFLNTQEGWVLVPDPNNMLVGTLYHTSNGGATWNSFAAPFGGGVLDFLDPKQGWMMASLGAGAGSMGVAIYQSIDGGSTWTQTYTNDPNQQGAGDSLPLGGLKDGLTALDMKTAWVGGITYAPGTIYLYQTQDSGYSWNQISIQAPDGYDQAELETTGPKFPTVDTAYLPITLTSQNGELLAVYSSHDGGKSWQLTPTLIPQGGAMDFVSVEDGFVWNGTQFYVTKDGAQTWTITSPDVSFGASFGGMDFISPSIGYVLTSDASGVRGLYKTTDAGATWNVLGK
jgi:photosystem II stability/assembly factor-like uncharacterized protein